MTDYSASFSDFSPMLLPAAVIQEMLRDLTRHAITFTETDLQHHLRPFLPPGVSDGVVAVQAAMILANPVFTSVRSDPVSGRFLYLARESVVAEQNMLADAAILAKFGCKDLNPDIVADILGQFRAHMPEYGFAADAVEPLETLNNLLCSGNLVLLEGPPGAKKSTLLKWLGLAFSNSARPVIATALSDYIAARQGRAMDAPALTLPELLENPPARDALVIVDEAGMIGSRMMADLLAKSREMGWKLVLAGDRQQLPPLESGQAFRLLADRLPAQAVTRLTATVRQPPSDRPATLALWQGDATAALAHYQSQNALAFVAPESLAIHAASHVIRHILAHPVQPFIIVTTTPEMAAQVNVALLRLRADCGLRNGIGRFQVGDRVILDQTITPANSLEPLYDGTLGRIHAIVNGMNGANGLEFVADDAPNEIIALTPEQAQHLSHAAALDVRRAQGIATPLAIAVIDAPLEAGAGLVLFSRHKQTFHALINYNVYPDIAALAHSVAMTPHRPCALDYGTTDEKSLPPFILPKSSRPPEPKDSP